MVHLPKPPSQFKNLFWDFGVVGLVVFPRQFIHLLLYLLAVTGTAYHRADSESTAIASKLVTKLSVFFQELD